MIRVERPLAPQGFDSPTTRRAQADALRWSQRAATAEQDVDHVYSPNQSVLYEVRDALVALFTAKCAYCETPEASAAVGHYRPPGSATQADGSTSAPHYAWLAYEWDNLLLVCPRCELTRGRRFPTSSPRGPIGASIPELRAEQPLLLDPCDDDPDEHLVFHDDGYVSGDTDRGRESIVLLDLNRTDLIAGRADAMAAAVREWQRGELDAAMSPLTPFAGARRQAVRRLVEGGFSVPVGRAEEADVAGSITPSIVETDEYTSIGDVHLKRRGAAEEEASAVTQHAVQANIDGYSLADESTNVQYFASGRFIERIEITNFRPIERLELTPTPTGEGPWLVLLGENAAGKSSVLKAVALALMGEQARNALADLYGIDARTFVRRGQAHGEVRVHLTGVSEPCALTFTRDDPRFGGTVEPKVLLLGYGATRLLPTPRNAAPTTTGAIAEIDNLFDPFTPLADAAAWLLSLPDDRFAVAARGLRSLLGLDSGETLYAEDGQIHARVLGSSVTLDQLSDGYQSVVAFAADVMSVLFARWDDLGAAEGVVLLDELGSHLHPRWRMRIVERLRVLFPRVQFVVTTHDPLCLRGLRDGEVAVLERLEDEARTVVVRTDLPPVAGMRVDQLLTSELFGLRSTVDPELEARFEEYYELKALRERTPEQDERIRQLAEQLEPLRVLGNTPAERLVLEAADAFLALRNRTTPTLDPAVLHQEAVAALRDMWAELEPERFG